MNATYLDDEEEDAVNESDKESADTNSKKTEFHGNYPSTFEEIANNIDLFLSHSFALAAKEATITSTEYKKIMVGFHKLRVTLAFVNDNTESPDKSVMDSFRTFVGIRFLEALHFLAPLCRKEAQQSEPICGEAVLGLMLYSIMGPKGLRWYPDCKSPDDTALRNNSLFDKDVFTENLDVYIDELKDTKGFKMSKDLQKCVQEFEEEYHRNKSTLYQENFQKVKLLHTDLVDFIPDSFSLKTPIKQAKKYMANSKISTAIPGNLTHSSSEKKKRKQKQDMNEDPDHPNKRGRKSGRSLDMNNRSPRTSMADHSNSDNKEDPNQES